MGKYIGPKCKIIRRLGEVLALTMKKCKKRLLSPGQHGKKMKIIDRTEYLTAKQDRAFCLLEKQKVRYTYGIREKQFIRYYKLAKHYGDMALFTFFKCLESRLDSILYRMGFSISIFSSKQYINHKHINVNTLNITIPSFLCQRNDTIALKKNSKITKLVEKIYSKFFNERKEFKKRIKNFKIKKSEIEKITEINASHFVPSYLKFYTTILKIHIFDNINLWPFQLFTELIYI